MPHLSGPHILKSVPVEFRLKNQRHEFGLSESNNRNPVPISTDVTKVDTLGEMFDVWRAERQSAVPGGQR